MVAERFKYQLVSLDTMNEQVNVRLPKAMLLKAKSYAKKHGFGSVQELVKESLREKIRGYEELTAEEAFLIKKVLEVSNKHNLFGTEEDLRKVLRKG
jgi:hypothetical protein